MGWGDSVMATADARRAYEKHGVRVVFGDGKRSWWDEVYLHNPKIAKKEELHTGEQFAWVTNHPQRRPYIEAIIPGRFIYRPEFKVEPGELFFSPKEHREPNQYIVIEPNVKSSMTGPNKDWGFNNWVKLVKGLKGRVVQLGPKDTGRRIKGVELIVTPTFRDAMVAMRGASLYIGPDGGLHHVAGALGLNAVVLWGGVASPKNLGYDFHTNIWHGAEPCGTVNGICGHCKEAMASITVEEVLKAVDGETAKTRH